MSKPVYIALWVLLAAAHPVFSAPAIVASRDDAFIAHDAGSLQWAIGSENLSLAVGFDSSGTLKAGPATNPATGRSWALTSNVAVTLAGTRVTLSNSGATALLSTQAIATDHIVRLTFEFEHRATHARIARMYACAPGSPTIEVWTRIIAPAGDPLILSDINGIDMLMPNATVRWIGGLRGDSADSVADGAFALDERGLDTDERIEIGAEGRSTSDYVPFVIVDDGRDEFYAGLMWSGSWRFAFQRTNDQLKINGYFPGVETNVAGRTFEFPHAFFGVRPDSSADESGALRQFIIRDIRKGRPFQPLVTYNTWFPYGARISQENVTGEMIRAAAIGVELFVVDAGWYSGAGANGYYDFTTGLGTYALDAERFPDGLAALADEAHGAGMKFGIWVEPERVSLDTVDKPSLAREPWLAQHDGSYGSSGSAQVCLGTAAARRWVLDRLIALIDASHADYVKWDNNFWINCNRSGHDHGPADGNMAHVQGLYSILAELRSRYPNLLIENVSGGGNRLDFGMLAYTDVAWMDDRSTPAALVRHNIEGLTFAFPPAYLLSFVVDGESESVRGNSDFVNMIRSRMPAVLGLSYQSPEVRGADLDAMIREIQNYKTIRNTIADANATLLSDQAPVDDTGWDVLQEVNTKARQMVLFAFKGNDEDGRLLVRPRDLDPTTTYDVRSMDTGPLGSATGDVLMNDGIEILHSAGSTRAHIILVTAR